MTTSRKRSAPTLESTEEEQEPAPPLPKSRDELMDSLPYIDVPNEDYEQYALALIEEEMKVIRPRALEELKPIHFRTPVMETEYQRFVDREGQPEPMQLSLPTATAPSKKTVDNWKNSVTQARTEYEAERLRSITLEVKKDAGAALLWKGFNGNLDQDMQALNDALKLQREAVEQINLQRSEDQQKAGQKLQILTHQYQEALQRTFQLHQATATLEQEVEGLS